MDKGRSVGVIGLGAMGRGIASSLLRAGFATHAYDVQAAALAEFAAQGGVAAASAAGLGAACDTVFVVVVNARQTEQALFGPAGAVEGLRPGSVVLACSTVAAEVAEGLGARLAEHGILMIDSPLSGGAAKSALGQLTMMASGAPEAFDKVQEVLAAVAAKVYRLGDAPGAGSRIKMINQLLAGVHIAAAAEAVALGLKAGVDLTTLYDVISNSAGSSWMFQNRVPHIIAGDYTPLSAVAIFVKDLGIVLDAARASSFPLPLTAAAHQMFLMAAAAGHAGEDDSAVVKIFPGIELPAKGGETGTAGR
ncbi:MAG: L-threonate dehydrogenase [Caldimonas sp.]